MREGDDSQGTMPPEFDSEGTSLHFMTRTGPKRQAASYKLLRKIILSLRLTFFPGFWTAKNLQRNPTANKEEKITSPCTGRGHEARVRLKGSPKSKGGVDTQVAGSSENQDVFSNFSGVSSTD